MLPISEHRQAAPAFQQALCPSKHGDFSSRPRLRRRFPVGTHHWFQAWFQAGTHHFARNRQGITDSGDTHIRADTLGPLIVKSRSGTPADKHPNRDHPRQPLPTTPKRFVPIRTDFC